MRGLREAEQEATAQREEMPRNSNERQWSGQKMQQPKERQWRVAVTESQVDGKQHNN